MTASFANFISTPSIAVGFAGVDPSEIMAATAGAAKRFGSKAAVAVGGLVSDLFASKPAPSFARFAGAQAILAGFGSTNPTPVAAALAGAVKSIGSETTIAIGGVAATARVAKDAASVKTSDDEVR